MSSARPLDNSNPTIVVPTSSTGPSPQFSKASQKTKLERLWRDETDDQDEEFEALGDSEEREEIDEQEVFGKFCPLFTLSLLMHSQTSSAQSQTPNTL
jgi:hypothetical protein